MASLTIACMPDFDRLYGNRGAQDSITSMADATSTAGQCTGTVAAPRDPSSLPKCACAKGGSARCVPKSEVPESVATQLDTCSVGGPGVCVPDAIVKSGGAAPPSCTTPFGEGRCMSMCVPQVATNAGVLDRGTGDVCAADERCVPCKNPLKSNEPTGVCEIGQGAGATCQAPTPTTKPASDAGVAPSAACPHTGPPVVDGTTFPSCGDGARCVPASVVPTSAASLLARCAGGLCAPEKSIAAGGNYLPKTCASIADAEGRCMNVNIVAVDAQKTLLPVDTCDPNERCAPCFDPTSGADTGTCRTVSCDAPKKAATTFQGCCSQNGADRGKCVPKALVPASQQSKLSSDGGRCAAQTVCAPNEMLTPGFVPPTCNGSSPLGGYSGVCISTCIHRDPIEQFGTSQGTCESGFFCAPCNVLGSPTGAPGCAGQ
jgi:hypothetical protein